MLNFFFDIHSSEGVQNDLLGTLFPDVASARSDAVTVAKQLARIRAQANKAPMEVTVVIRNEDGEVIDTVRLSD